MWMLFILIDITFSNLGGNNSIYHLRFLFNLWFCFISYSVYCLFELLLLKLIFAHSWFWRMAGGLKKLFVNQLLLFVYYMLALSPVSFSHILIFFLFQLPTLPFLFTQKGESKPIGSKITVYFLWNFLDSITFICEFCLVVLRLWTLIVRFF